MTFDEIVPLYLTYCQNTKKLEPLTLKAYRIDLGQLCNWLNANIQTNISLVQVNKTIILFATGMRVSELSNVKLSDWDRNSQTFRITGKGEKERILYIGNQTVLSAIDNYIKTRPPTINNYLFINRIGERLSEQSIRFFIEKLGKTALNKHITPHMLRHSFATLLLEEGVDITYIKSFLGHSSISTTQIYASASTLRQRQILFAYHPRNRIHLSE